MRRKISHTGEILPTAATAATRVPSLLGHSMHANIVPTEIIKPGEGLVAASERALRLVYGDIDQRRSFAGVGTVRQ
jgi:hypothetical protein